MSNTPNSNLHKMIESTNLFLQSLSKSQSTTSLNKNHKVSVEINAALMSSFERSFPLVPKLSRIENYLQDGDHDDRKYGVFQNNVLCRRCRCKMSSV